MLSRQSGIDYVNRRDLMQQLLSVYARQQQTGPSEWWVEDEPVFHRAVLGPLYDVLTRSCSPAGARNRQALDPHDASPSLALRHGSPARVPTYGRG